MSSAIETNVTIPKTANHQPYRCMRSFTSRTVVLASSKGPSPLAKPIKAFEWARLQPMNAKLLQIFSYICLLCARFANSLRYLLTLLRDFSDIEGIMLVLPTHLFSTCCLEQIHIQAGLKSSAHYQLQQRVFAMLRSIHTAYHNRTQTFFDNHQCFQFLLVW